jgi:hypothetical protein
LIFFIVMNYFGVEILIFFIISLHAIEIR